MLASKSYGAARKSLLKMLKEQTDGLHTQIIEKCHPVRVDGMNSAIRIYPTGLRKNGYSIQLCAQALAKNEGQIFKVVEFPTYSKPDDILLFLENVGDGNYMIEIGLSNCISTF